MRSRFAPRSLLCAFAAFAAVTPAVRAADAFRDIPFSSPGAPGDQLLLNLYLPSAATTPIPTTIIICHGGSYYTGSRYELEAISLALADLGYTVITPEYTLVTLSSASYPQPISDVLNVVHWVRTEGELINLPNRVVLGGVSAGATIAITAALAAPTPIFNRLPAPANRGYIIDGAIGAMGRYDLVWNAYLGIPQTVIDYIGVPFSNPAWPQTWAQASAISYVNANSPPTYLIHGTSDGLVPYFNSVRLYGAMTQAGAPVQLALIPGGGHDMSVLGPTAALQAQTIAAAAAWIDTGVAPPAPGSCCAPNGFCSVAMQVACQWTFNSGGACSPNLCQQPVVTGACCLSSGACQIMPRNDCNDQWNGGVSCSPNPCPPPPPPLGACCALTGLCSFTPQSFCQHDWTADTLCQPNPCQQPPPPPPPLGACCAPDGSCASSIAADCGTVWLFAAVCQPNPCAQPPPPVGACCMGASCTVTIQSGCAGPNHRFTGDSTTCNATPASTTPCCRADFDQNAALGVADIFEYLASWFASSPDCCIASPAGSSPNVQDIFEFLGAWFSGC